MAVGPREGGATTRGNAPEPKPGLLVGRSEDVAILTRSVDLVYEAGSPAPRIGSALPRCSLRIRSGWLQLEFQRGAIVVVEGPAQVDLLLSDQMACRTGKLRAVVPPRARGFRVDTPRFSLVDLGTEFGVQVGPDRDAEVHVFAGKVELHESDAFGTRAANIESSRGWVLTAGQAMRLTPIGDATSQVARPNGFLAPSDLENLYRARVRRRYEEWLASSARLNEDHDLVAYYPFEGQRPPGSRVLRNVRGDGSSDGAIVGCEWVDGRWAGKGALEFKRLGDRVRIQVPGSFDTLTLAAWVRIDALEHRFNSLMLTDGFDPGESHWQIDFDGRLVLGIRNEANAKTWRTDYASPRVFTSDRLGRWTHLATVFDDPGGTVTHYVDGAAVWTGPLVRRAPISIGSAELGNWGSAAWHELAPIRNLRGRMDEFMVFRAALGPAEIENLYLMGVP